MVKARMADGAVKRTLAQIDAVLAGGGPVAKALWDILGGAVRGPDSGDPKDSTTSVLRVAAFPKAAANGQLGAVAAVNTAFNGPIRVGARAIANEHFRSHVKASAQALGLDVDCR